MRMNRRFSTLLMVALVVTGLLVAGCSSSKKKSDKTSSLTSSSAQSGSQGGGASGSVEVDIKNFAFTPQTVKVKAGGTVKWVNKDNTTHTATDKGVFDTGDLSSGASMTVTFAKPGTYKYICSIHNYMTGTVVVTS